MVDPDAELEDDCLVVIQFERSMPRVTGWWRTHRDIHGRFIPVDDPLEAFSFGFFKYTAKNTPCKWWRLLGRVVAEPPGL